MREQRATIVAHAAIELLVYEARPRLVRTTALGASEASAPYGDEPMWPYFTDSKFL